MFTGIIQSIATVAAINDLEGLRRITVAFEKNFCSDLAIGGSVAVDGVCLTAVKVQDAQHADFEIMLQSLNTTTLYNLVVGSKINVERAAKQGAEVGGHQLSGHIDFCGKIISIQQPQNNYLLRFEVPKNRARYIFSKGYIALNGASLTVSEVDRHEGWFEIWLIPETLRQTTFFAKKVNDLVNIEIDRNTQIIVDTITFALQEQLAVVQSSLEKK